MTESASRKNRTKYRIVHDTLVIDLGQTYRIVSSAPRGGGIVRGRSILNHQVPANPVKLGPQVGRKWCNPARYLGRVAMRVKAEWPIVGLMTAVPMRQVVIDREQSGALFVECFCTVGVTNAVRAGERAMFDEGMIQSPRTGTINIILITNATLALPAMIGAVQVATESKTATLMKNRVRSTSGRRGLATGTGTDAVVLASNLQGRHRLLYSGTHTKIGSMIGRLVCRCVQKGLNRSSRWCKDNP